MAKLPQHTQHSAILTFPEFHHFFFCKQLFFSLLLFKAEKWFANILFLNGTACNTDTITFQHAVWNPRSRIAYWYSICRLCNLLGEHAINENLNEIKRVKLKRAMFSFCKQVQETTSSDLLCNTLPTFSLFHSGLLYCGFYFSPSLFDWHRDCSIMMSWDRFESILQG